MQMGIKEFRERLGEVARGSEAVQLTDRGRVIGVYSPLPRWTPERRARSLQAAAEIERMHAEWRAAGIDRDELMAELGLDPWGIPLDQVNDR